MDQVSREQPVAAPGGSLRKPSYPEPVTDAEKLAASIERAVRIETCGRVRNLCVEVTRGRVLLAGRCTSYYTKQMAQHAAMIFSGGRELTNSIEVV